MKVGGSSETSGQPQQTATKQRHDNLTAHATHSYIIDYVLITNFCALIIIYS